MNTEETSLFADKENSHEPLASRMRPRTLDEYIGQDHIVGKGRLLRRAIAADQLSSVIFYGPPGSGKTTLARVIANHTSSNFLTLNAVLTGVADIRKAISDAEQKKQLYGKKTILFVDEVHRWNKSQQDALLPWVENGTIILIGATTENPFFEVNKALVSRSRVFQLKALTDDDLLAVARQTLSDTERGYGHWKVSFEEGALEHLVKTASGDARSLLNALELAVETTPAKWEPNANPPKPSWGSTIYISCETAEESIQKKVVLYDKDGDYHYDIISAFIKSLRGRDPDAACYWLARMVRAGEDPDFIFRRMLISACEDTGLADPNAITVVTSCAAAFDRVGMPEGRYFLAHAALYLATAPKSNSSMAFFDALSSVEKEDTEVPNHLRDPSRDAEGFGHGAGYLYPHAYRDHWVAQQYLPDALVGRVFYTPTTQGYEAKIREDVLSRRELQIAAILEKKEIDPGENPIGEWWKNPHYSKSPKQDENLTFSPENKQKENALERADRSWQTRLETNRAAALLEIRNKMTQTAALLRHHRSLVWNADDALLLFELLRKCPEGAVCGVCRNSEGMSALEQYSATLGDVDKPLLTVAEQNGKALQAENFYKTLSAFSDVTFDRMFFRDPIASAADAKTLAESLLLAFKGQKKSGKDIAFSETDSLNKDRAALFSKDAAVVIAQRIPCRGQHISELLQNTDISDKKLIDRMEKCETDFFSDQSNPLFNWNEDSIKQLFEQNGLAVHTEMLKTVEKRFISEIDIERWFSPSSAYGTSIRNTLGDADTETIKKTLAENTQKQSVDWQTVSAIFFVHL